MAILQCKLSNHNNLAHTHFLFNFGEFVGLDILILRSPVTTTHRRSPPHRTSLKPFTKQVSRVITQVTGLFRKKKTQADVLPTSRTNVFTPDIVKWRIRRHNAINNHSKHCHFQLKDPQRIQTRRMSSDVSLT